MNQLPQEKKALILSLLTEGQSIRATSRITGVEKKTITRLLVKAGDKARDIHDTMIQNLQSKQIQVDELVDLHYFFHNFIKIHKTLRVTPAMEAKVTNRLWSWEDLLTWNESRIAA